MKKKAKEYMVKAQVKNVVKKINYLMKLWLTGISFMNVLNAFDIFSSKAS